MLPIGSRAPPGRVFGGDGEFTVRRKPPPMAPIFLHLGQGLAGLICAAATVGRAAGVTGALVGALALGSCGVAALGVSIAREPRRARARSALYVALSLATLAFAWHVAGHASAVAHADCAFAKLNAHLDRLERGTLELEEHARLMEHDFKIRLDAVDEATSSGWEEGGSGEEVRSAHLKGLWRASDSASARREARALAVDGRVAAEVARELFAEGGGLARMRKLVQKRMSSHDVAALDAAKEAISQASRDIEAQLGPGCTEHPLPQAYERLVDSLQSSCMQLLAVVRDLRAVLGEREARGLPTRASILAALRGGDARRRVADSDGGGGSPDPTPGSGVIAWAAVASPPSDRDAPDNTHARPFPARDASLPWMRDALGRLRDASGHDGQRRAFEGQDALDAWRARWQRAASERPGSERGGATFARAVSSAAGALNSIGEACTREQGGQRALLSAVSLLGATQCAALILELPRAWGRGGVL